MKLFRNKLLLIVIMISIILLAGIIITSQGRTRPSVIEGLLGRIISPMQKAVYSVGRFFGDSFSNLSELRTLKRENEEHEKEILALREENRRLIRHEIENIGYRQALDFKNDNNNMELIGANVTGKDPGNWFDIYTIDKGQNDGVNQNDAIVLGYGYLVGKVIEVGPNYSKFIALTDQRSSVSIVVNRTRAQGIAKGNSDNDIVAIMPIEADISEKDDIFTSGYSTYPKDLYLGKVKSVEKQERKLQKVVIIEPAVDFNKLEDVFVLKAGVR